MQLYSSCENTDILCTLCELFFTKSCSYTNKLLKICTFAIVRAFECKMKLKLVLHLILTACRSYSDFAQMNDTNDGPVWVSNP